MSTPAARPSFFAELQRRHVYKVGAMYAVAGWLLVQVVTQVLPIFDVSALAQRIIVLAIIAGFPAALVLSWVFDLTPQGLVRTDAHAMNETPAITRQRRGMDRKLNYLLGALLLIAAGYFGTERAGFVGRPGDVQSGGGAGAGAGNKSIAVLPFENLSDDKNNAYFASGIQDEILTRLAGIADLKVISRTSAEKYASRPDNLKTVAAELGVATLLEGSVQKSGERVRVNVQLIDARADAHLWASTYDRELKDAFAVESDVSQDIADALKAKLSPSEVSALAKAPTQNAAAYDLYLQGDYQEHAAEDSALEADFRQAEERYRQALALDPGFALADARLAYCILSRHWFSKPLPPAELAATKTLVDRALALAPELAEAQEALGYYHYWGYRDYEPAKAAFRRQLELEPNSAQAIGALGYIHRRQGEWPEALTALAKAISYAPRDSLLSSNYGQTFLAMRRYQASDRELRRALALDPASMMARSFLATNELFGFGDAQSALQVFEGLAIERKSPSNDFGDVLNVVNLRAYPYLFERRFDDALKVSEAWPAETGAQRIDRLSARIAIQVLAGQRQSMQAECEALRGLLEPEVARQPDAFPLLADLGWVYVCLGRDADAIRTARHATELRPLAKDALSGAHYLVGLAQIEAWSNAPEAALKIITQLLAIPAGGTMSIARLKLDPVWDPLRTDPRFQKLIADGEAVPR